MIITDMRVITAVLALRKKFPGLTIDGLQLVPGDKAQDDIACVMEDALHHIKHIPLCICWLHGRTTRNTFNTNEDTYGYKHMIEALECDWVSHMSLLIAAQLEGMEMKQNPNRMWAALLKIGVKRR